MSRFILSAAILSFMAVPALALPPAGFETRGIATSFATTETPEQSTPFKLYFQNGKVRMELKLADGAPSVILAQRGAKTVTLLDTSQKMAFTTTMADLSTLDGTPPLSELLDASSWKANLAKHGKRLPGIEIKGSETCSIWQKESGNTSYKVWFSDKQELPMQIEGSVSGKLRFRFVVQHLATGKQDHAFFTIPAGYQHAQLMPDARP